MHILSTFSSILSVKAHLVFLVLLLFAIGSNMLNYHLYIPIAVALLLIDWRKMTQKNVWIVMLFVLTLYITWVILIPEVLHSYDLAMQVFPYGIMILLMYLLGFSIRIKESKGVIVSDKFLFYALFAFVLAYTLCILWSYMTIEQDNPLTWVGLFVCFENEYHRININGGRLISTIIAYYLTIITFLIPLIILFYNAFRKQGFSAFELTVLLLLSFFALYIGALMGRRTVFVLFGLVFGFLLLMRFVNLGSLRIHMKRATVTIGILGLIGYGIFIWQDTRKSETSDSYIIVTTDTIVPITQKSTSFVERIHIENIPVFKRLVHQGMRDKRFSWWSRGFRIILDHPFGGGNAVYITPVSKLVHNTWLDVGKDFGLPTFILLILITLLHLYYLIYIFFSKKVESLLKYQVAVIGIGVFAIMMIEPVFNSDKIFFAYIFFYFGVLANLYHNLRKDTATVLSPHLAPKDRTH